MKKTTITALLVLFTLTTIAAVPDNIDEWVLWVAEDLKR